MGLRILLVSDFYAPFIGGAERQIRLLAHELAERGHCVRVVTVWHDGLPLAEDDNGVPLLRVKALSTRIGWFSNDPDRRYHPPFPDPVMTWRLRRIVSDWQPDVIHAQGWVVYSCAAALLGSAIPLVVSVRDYGYSCATRNLLHEGKICSGPGVVKCLGCARQSYGQAKAVVSVGGVFGWRWLLRRKTTAAVSVSTFVQRILLRDLVSPTPSNTMSCQTIPNIVMPEDELPSMKDADKKWLEQLPTEAFILFVGALQHHKGLGPLLAAYQQLDPAPPLVLIGTRWHDTPDTFPAGVTVLQNVPHAVVMAAWQRALFGVTPSIWPDPLPGVVREAMSAGKAVVATAVGGNLDMVEDEVNGILVQPEDVDGLRDAMARLVEDEGLRTRLGAAGRRSVRRLTAESVLPQFEALYHSLVNRPGPTVRPVADSGNPQVS